MRCVCQASADAAVRDTRIRTHLARDRGRYAHATVATFSTAHALPGSVVWEESRWDDRHQRWISATYRPDAQRQMLVAAQQRVAAWVKHPDAWLYLMGNYGSGKTHLAVAALNALELAGYTTHYDSLPDLLRLLRQGVANHTTDQRLADLQEVGVLMLDDLGAEHLTGWGAEQLFSIINERDRHDRLTVVTSNRPLEALAQGRIGSRLAGRCEVIPLIAYDYRVLRQRQPQGG